MKFLSVLIVFVALANMGCGIYPTNGVYLIPEGYTGGVIILYDQSDGIEPEVENGLYVYEIPDDGVLRVKITRTTGRVNKKYFYLTDSGQREKINYLRVTGNRDINGKSKSKFGDLTQVEIQNKVFVMSDQGNSFHSSFIVGKPVDGTHMYLETEKKVLKFTRNSLPKPRPLSKLSEL